MILSLEGEQVESWNFQFGILRDGSQGWKYWEGSRINGQVLSSFFPDFPPDYRFPRVSRERR
jgi:hypothetical protein